MAVFSSPSSHTEQFYSLHMTYLQLYWFAKHHLVEGSDEEPVQQLAVVDSHA